MSTGMDRDPRCVDPNAEGSPPPAPLLLSLCCALLFGVFVWLYARGHLEPTRPCPPPDTRELENAKLDRDEADARAVFAEARMRRRLGLDFEEEELGCQKPVPVARRRTSMKPEPAVPPNTQLDPTISSLRCAILDLETDNRRFRARLAAAHEALHEASVQAGSLRDAVKAWHTHSEAQRLRLAKLEAELTQLRRRPASCPPMPNGNESLQCSMELKK